ncbi:MAG: biotin/lipoyl-binding protein [Bacteroidota bacterium]
MPHLVPPSEENLEIFEKPAGWMLYWGTAIVVIFILLILGLAAFIQYPDKLEFQVSVTSNPPPLPMVVQYAGQVEQVLVADGEQVQEGQVLMILASAARWPELQYLDSTLEVLQQIDNPLAVAALKLREPLRLDKLSFTYTQLLNYTAELQEKLRRQPVLQRMGYLDQQIAETDILRKNLDDQMETLRLELAIAERNLQQYEELLRRESASQIEVDQSATRLLDVQRRIEEQRNRLSQARSREASLQEQKTRLRAETDDELLNLWLTWKAQVRSLQQEFYDWEDQHLLRASQRGQVVFFEPLSTGVPLASQQMPLGIIPQHDSLSYQAEGLLPDLGSGDINAASEAYLEVLAYPSERYGKIKVEIQSIAAAPQSIGEGYRIVLHFPEGLTTTHGKTLQFRQQMLAQATILAEKRSLLNRLFDRLRQLTDSQ